MYVHNFDGDFGEFGSIGYELIGEELEQVAGGYLFHEYCPICGCKLVEEGDEHSYNFWHVCPDCGYKEMH